MHVSVWTDGDAEHPFLVDDLPDTAPRLRKASASSGCLTVIPTRRWDRPASLLSG
jgi:hypothetical protein